MTPKSFDIATAKEYVGDARMREIETKARTDADANAYAPPHGLRAVFASYASEVAGQMKDIVYLHAYKKRKDRIERMAAGANEPAQNNT